MLSFNVSADDMESDSSSDEIMEVDSDESSDETATESATMLLMTRMRTSTKNKPLLTFLKKGQFLALFFCIFLNIYFSNPTFNFLEAPV